MLAGRTRDEVEALYRAREPYYRQADLTVDTTGLNTDQVVAQVLLALEPPPLPSPPWGEGRVRGRVADALARSSTRLARAAAPLRRRDGHHALRARRAARRLLRRAQPQRAQGRAVASTPSTSRRAADAIETNTFGANRFKLAVHGLQARVREINLRGAKLARDVRESMGRDVLVLGSIGPLGKYLAPLGSIEPEEARAAFREQAEGLLEGGVDAFVIETFSDLTEMRLAVEAVRAITDLPIVAEVAFTDDGRDLHRPHRRRGRRARSASCPIQAVGANCSVGSSVLYDILEQMLPEAGGLHVVIQPNAGLPSRVGERLMYLSSPGYMADYAARMIGGGRAAGRRLLRHDAAAHPRDAGGARPPRAPARAPARVEPAAARPRRGEPSPPALATTAPPTPAPAPARGARVRS